MMEFDVPVERLYLDPLLLPVSVAQQQALEAAEAISMFKQLNEPPLKTVVGLSNIYNGCPEHIKAPMAAALLALLIPMGLDAAIMDPNDEGQMMVARTAPADLQMDDTMVKTMAVLRNQTLYCSSYLD
jgi:5-methyltetrahydrofolate corrinoid/iron sulfur protein methyltransferase